jgi:hypothetical protein
VFYYLERIRSEASPLIYNVSIFSTATPQKRQWESGRNVIGGYSALFGFIRNDTAPFWERCNHFVEFDPVVRLPFLLKASNLFIFRKNKVAVGYRKPLVSPYIRGEGTFHSF